MEKLFETIKNQSEQIMEIQKIAYNCGFEDGKKARDKELEIKKGEELEAMYQDSLADEEFARKADLDAEAERQK